jgi:disulfide bond formation protein DsbB
MHMLTPRWFFAATACTCVALLAYGYYLQFHDGLEPCPMCIFQRLCYMAVAAVGIVATVHGPQRLAATLYAALALGFAGVGAGIAGRQVWLQHLPPERVPECGPGLEFMLEVYPLLDVIRTALRGTGECASVNWTFLGGSIALWSMVCFGTLMLAQVAFMTHCYRHNRASAAN